MPDNNSIHFRRKKQNVWQQINSDINELNNKLKKLQIKLETALINYQLDIEIWVNANNEDRKKIDIINCEFIDKLKLELASIEMQIRMIIQ